ncbi:hypothetical protein LTR04_006246 [Oleoguttula sp. CCFEE 6159]|nr:hypothetical protein LTR04_006246 [Oleoguttula sp. CCFEE 6159]
MTCNEVATADIEADEELFTIPRSAVLTVENSELFTRLRGQATEERMETLPVHDFRADFLDGLGPWVSLILVMMYEYLKGPESRWWPYFDVLPSKFDTLMFWSSDELDELQASAVRDKIGKKYTDQVFRNDIVGMIAKHPDILLPTGTSEPKAEELIGMAHRMGSTIMAYAFDLEKSDNENEKDEEGFAEEEEDEWLPKGMVPLADMLNAEPEGDINAGAGWNNARLFYGESTLTMRATKSIQAGEEVFNDYGPLPRSDLLRRYGYITPKYAQHDVVEISRSTIVDVVTADHKLKKMVKDKLAYMAQKEVFEDGDEGGYDLTHPIRKDTRSCFSEDLLLFITVLLLDDSEYRQLKRQGKLPRVETVLQIDVAKILKRLIEVRVAQYPTAADEDQKLLADMGDDTTSRKAMAVQVRLGEKTILEECRDVLDVYV